MIKFLIVLNLFAGGAQAQDWALRDGDTSLDSAAIEAQVIGQKIVFYDNGESRFSPGGAYSYTYYQGGTAYGVFRVEADGVICIDYRNGFGRCDKYVRNGDALVLLTESGERYPIRP